MASVRPERVGRVDDVGVGEQQPLAAGAPGTPCQHAQRLADPAVGQGRAGDDRHARVVAGRRAGRRAACRRATGRRPRSPRRGRSRARAGCGWPCRCRAPRRGRGRSRSPAGPAEAAGSASGAQGAPALVQGEGGGAGPEGRGDARPCRRALIGARAYPRGGERRRPRPRRRLRHADGVAPSSSSPSAGARCCSTSSTPPRRPGSASWCVVLGHAAGEVAAALALPPGARVVVNPRHAEGQVDVARGRARGDARRERRGRSVLLGDQPEVRPDAIRAVVAARVPGGRADAARGLRRAARAPGAARPRAVGRAVAGCAATAARRALAARDPGALRPGGGGRRPARGRGHPRGPPAARATASGEAPE